MKKVNIPLKIILPIGIGILLVVLATIFGATLQKSNVVNVSDATVTEQSSNGLEAAWVRPFELGEDQHIQIILSCNTANDSINLMIIPEGLYVQQEALNSTPGSITGLSMVTYVRSWGETPVGVNTALLTASPSMGNTITVEAVFGGAFLADAWGDDHVVTVPGKYVIVVYGTDADTPSTVSDVTFSLQVITDGPGPVLQIVFAIVGYGLFIVGVVLALLEYKPKLFFGGDEE
jgi:hypothetical protein